MTEYQIFLQERDKIDFLLQKGYKMTSVIENLSGAFVDFEGNGQKETLHIITPEGRKYFAVMLIKQQLEGA